MSALASIIAKLARFPGLRFGRLGNRLDIEKSGPDGFPLSFVEGEKDFTVTLGSCRWRFSDADEALEYLAFGLSDKCRLRELIRGKPYKWIIEQKTGSGWQAMNETGLIFFRFWKSKRERFYQNAVFKSGET